MKKLDLLVEYENGNSKIQLFEDGTRIIEFDNTLELEHPLNVDIRVQSKCALGYNSKTQKSSCTFCHESATTNGKECDYDILKNTIKDLPKGIELAIGCNHYSTNLWSFLEWCKSKGFICNLTINQLILPSIKDEIKYLLDKKLILGLGVSYRKSNRGLSFTEYDNTVIHVIAGIDDFDVVLELSNKGVKKILVLGEKDFGFNQGNVDLNSKSHKKWLWNINKLFYAFGVVSFDNLALEQLKIKRFLTKEKWDVIYQSEHSFYINAVDEYFSPSSRNTNKTYFNEINIQEYFKKLKRE